MVMIGEEEKEKEEEEDEENGSKPQRNPQTVKFLIEVQSDDGEE